MRHTNVILIKLSVFDSDHANSNHSRNVFVVSMGTEALQKLVRPALFIELSIIDAHHLMLCRRGNSKPRKIQKKTSDLDKRIDLNITSIHSKHYKATEPPEYCKLTTAASDKSQNLQYSLN